MAYHAIALVPIVGTQSTVPHNIRVGGYKSEQTAKQKLDEWCAKNNVRFGYVQPYGGKPVYVRGV